MGHRLLEPTSRPSAAADRVASSRIRELLDLVDRPDVLSLAGGLPDVSLLDEDRVRAAFAAALGAAGPSGSTALQYGPTAGIEPLRSHLADRLDVDVSATVVTTGSQQALDLLARSLCAPGDVAVLEAPAYLGAVQAFRASDARLIGVPGDADGMDVEALDSLVDDGVRPAVVYVVPDHHNPTGTVMSAERRRRLLAVAARVGAVVVEDAAYRDLRWGPPTAPLIGRGERVVHVGSSSKVLAPGLRIGWLAGPADVVAGVTRLKQSVDLHTATANQLVVAHLLSDGAQPAHLERLRRTYRERSVALVAALRRRLGDRVEVRVPDGGMFVWLQALDGTDTDALLDRAVDRGVAFVPGSAFTLDDAPSTTARLSFATLGPPQLAQAVGRLAAAWSP
jgi:2-aminoadipate transaminase